MTIFYTSNQDFHKIINHDFVLLAFSSKWCEPCKRMHSVLKEIDSEMNGKIKIAIQDLYESKEIAEHFDIIGTPALILLKDGEILEKIIGYQHKEDITDLIRKHI